MSTRWRGPMLAVGTALLAISGVMLASVGHPAVVDQADLVGTVGLALGAVGLTLLLIVGGIAVFGAAAPVGRDIVGEISVSKLGNRILKQGEVADIVKMGRAFISGAHPSEDVLRARMRRNPEIVRVLSERVGAREKFRGYTIIYPLTAEAVESINEGTLKSVKDLRAKQIAKSNSDAAGLYISMIGGHGPTARATALAVLRAQIRSALVANPKIEMIFARPATSAGLRLLRKFEFHPLAGDDSIWAIGGDALGPYRAPGL